MADAVVRDKEMVPPPSKETLGTIQLRHHDTNQVILVPTPSRDPNDPLNWPLPQKQYLFGLICTGVFLVNFAAVGPSVALEQITIDYFGDGPDLMDNLSNKVSYLQTACSLMIGVGNLIWVPLAIKIYTCALSCGAGAGVVIAGLITMHHTWRTFYWVSTALIGFVTVLVILSFPETGFKRQETIDRFGALDGPHITEPVKPSAEHAEEVVSVPETDLPPKKTWLQSLRIFTTTYTDESLPLMIFRTIIALALPAVFWATLINSITIGMIVVLSSNFSTAFSTIDGFKPWQSGLTFIASIIGSLIAIFTGGHLSDWVADRLTVKNGGVRKPEMRLPALIVSLITGPLSCILYGVGFGKKLHWICPVFGIGLGEKAVARPGISS
ncbi:hypothetical protein Plec18170_005772 [Paecilomyces lecythidis]